MAKVRRVKKSSKDKVWEYIRRNRVFCIKELMLVIKIDKTYLKSFIWILEATGYLKVAYWEAEFKNRCYTLIRNSGPITPKTESGEVYDYNLKQTFYIKNKLKELFLKVLDGVEAQEDLLEQIGIDELLSFILALKKSKKVQRVDVIDNFIDKFKKENL